VGVAVARERESGSDEVTGHASQEECENGYDSDVVTRRSSRGCESEAAVEL
jgi:hypothetical protein